MALGSVIGKPHGDVACFSFHPRKILSTGDGGMITTRNKDWDSKFRLWRQHSMSVSDTVRHSANSVIFESYPEIGFNYRMTDVQAAIGREQLKRLPEIVSARREKAEDLSLAARGCCRPGTSRRADLGTEQLAELLCEAAGGRRSETSHAIAAE